MCCSYHWQPCTVVDLHFFPLRAVGSRFSPCYVVYRIGQIKECSVPFRKFPLAQFFESWTSPYGSFSVWSLWTPFQSFLPCRRRRAFLTQLHLLAISFWPSLVGISQIETGLMLWLLILIFFELASGFWCFVYDGVSCLSRPSMVSIQHQNFHNADNSLYRDINLYSYSMFCWASFTFFWVSLIILLKDLNEYHCN